MAQSSGGLPVAVYCRRHGLRAHGFYWWRRELARREAQKPPAFLPVTVVRSAPPTMGRVEIFLSGHRRVRVIGPVDRRMLADVLSVLEERERRGGQREGLSC